MIWETLGDRTDFWASHRRAGGDIHEGPFNPPTGVAIA
jgi:hypothetical protein